MGSCQYAGKKTCQEWITVHAVDESHQKVTLEYCLDIARAASGGASFSS
jgi:hypothetical protein